MTARFTAPHVCVPLVGALASLWLLTIALGEMPTRLPFASGVFFAVQSTIAGVVLLTCILTPLGNHLQPRALLLVALFLGPLCAGASIVSDGDASAIRAIATWGTGAFGGLYLALALRLAARLLPKLEYRNAVATVAASLIVATVAYVILTPWHLLASTPAMLVLLCLSATLATLRMPSSAPYPDGTPTIAAPRQRVSSLALFATFSLTICCIGTSGTAPQDWGWGAALAGLVLGAVSLVAPSSKLLSVSFMAAAGALCTLSILSLSAPLDLAPWGHLAMLLGFWILEANALTLGFSSPIYVFYQGPGAPVAHLGVLYLTQGIGTVLNHTLPMDLQGLKALASALVLMGALLGAFYLLGKRTALAECATQQEGARLLFARLSTERSLTSRESQVMELIARGHSLKSIASTLGVAPNTVKAYRTNLYAKLGIHSRQELVDLAAMDADALQTAPFASTP